MSMSWFHYPVCTTEEADELVRRYNQRGIRTERSLNSDYRTWMVSALLPEYRHIPRGKEVCRYLR
ncbi:hypothetical protein DPO11_22920 [Salmonella enterica]|nr:hypothetical protein [Salmonella enterica]